MKLIIRYLYKNECLNNYLIVWSTSCAMNKVGMNKLNLSKADEVDMSNGHIRGRHSSSISLVEFISK